MINNITASLSMLNLSKYVLSIDGTVYKIKPKKREIKRDKSNVYTLIDDCGNRKRISLKQLYRKLFNKEYCIDNIEDLKNEIWKEINATNGRYYISNYSRVKSYCRYNAIIIQQHKKSNGYLDVKINGKNILVHQLVAFYFCENKYEGEKVEIHHTDFRRCNNYYKNLEILTIEEHRKRHQKRKPE